MACESLKLRKSQNTLTGVVITSLLVMVIFFGAFEYMTHNTIGTSGSIDEKYNASYDNLTIEREKIENQTEEVHKDLKSITEAKSTFSVAWNGFKALGNTIKLTTVYIGSLLTVWTSLLFPLDILPRWLIPIIFTGLLAYIVFLILKVMKGEPNM